jgi:ketosteroid isomerase-like protein
VNRLHINPWLIAVIALAAGLVALSAWTLVDRTSRSEPAAVQIVDDLDAAVNAGDAEAVRALFARDAVFQVSTGERISGLDNVVNAALIPHGVGFRLERVAPVTTAGDTAATFTKHSNGAEGVELVVLRLRDGKIVRMAVYDEG